MEKILPNMVVQSIQSVQSDMISLQYPGIEVVAFGGNLHLGSDFQADLVKLQTLRNGRLTFSESGSSFNAMR